MSTLRADSPLVISGPYPDVDLFVSSSESWDRVGVPALPPNIRPMYVLTADYWWDAVEPYRVDTDRLARMLQRYVPPARKGLVVLDAEHPLPSPELYIALFGRVRDILRGYKVYLYAWMDPNLLSYFKQVAAFADGIYLPVHTGSENEIQDQYVRDFGTWGKTHFPAKPLLATFIPQMTDSTLLHDPRVVYQQARGLKQAGIHNLGLFFNGRLPDHLTSENRLWASMMVRAARGQSFVELE